MKQKRCRKWLEKADNWIRSSRRKGRGRLCDQQRWVRIAWITPGFLGLAGWWGCDCMKHLGSRWEAEFVKDEEVWQIRGKKEEWSSEGVGKSLSVAVQTDHALESMKPLKHCLPPAFFFFSCSRYLANSWQRVLYACNDGPYGER